MATQPAYGATPIVDQAQVTTANTDKTGATTTNMVSVSTGTASGKRIRRVRVSAGATMVAGSVVFFYSPDGGTTRRPLCECLVSAIASSNTAKAFNDIVPELSGFELVSTNAILYATTTITQTLNIHVESDGL